MSSQKPFTILSSGFDPKINVFRKRRRTIQNAGLPTDQQVLDAVISQASEKVCDHGLLADSPSESASPGFAAIARLLQFRQLSGVGRIHIKSCQYY
jgi:hypothetical protein